MTFSNPVARETRLILGQIEIKPVADGDSAVSLGDPGGRRGALGTFVKLPPRRGRSRGPCCTAEVDGAKAGHLYLSLSARYLGRACGAIWRPGRLSRRLPNFLPTDATISGSDCWIFSNPSDRPALRPERSHFVASAATRPPKPFLMNPGPTAISSWSRCAGRPSRRTDCASLQALGAGPDVLGAPSFWQSSADPVGAPAPGPLMLAWEIEGIQYSDEVPL